MRRCTTGRSRISPPSAPPRGARRLHLHQLRRPGDADARPALCPAAGLTLADPPLVNDNLGSPAAAHTTMGVERVAPLFHLFNGDLCYANLAQDRVRACGISGRTTAAAPASGRGCPRPATTRTNWATGRSATRPISHISACRRPAGQTELTRGLWYAFTAGSVRVSAWPTTTSSTRTAAPAMSEAIRRARRGLAGDRTRRRARGPRHRLDRGLHAPGRRLHAAGNGADLGVREEWRPCSTDTVSIWWSAGTSSYYERSHPIRGQEANATRTPVPVATGLDVSTPHGARCTWSSAAAARPGPATRSSTTRRDAG